MRWLVIAGWVAFGFFAYGCILASVPTPGIPLIPFSRMSRLRNIAIRLIITPIAGLWQVASGSILIVGVSGGVAVFALGHETAKDVASREYGPGLSREPVIMVLAIVIGLAVLLGGGWCWVSAFNAMGKKLRHMVFSLAWRWEGPQPFLSIFCDTRSGQRTYARKQHAARYLVDEVRPDSPHGSARVQVLETLTTHWPESVWRELLCVLSNPAPQRDLSRLTDALKNDDNVVRENAIVAMATVFPVMDPEEFLHDWNDPDRPKRAEECLVAQAPVLAEDMAARRELGDLISNALVRSRVNKRVQTCGARLTETLRDDRFKKPNNSIDCYDE